MQYRLREIEIPFVTKELIEFDAQNLCKIVECRTISIDKIAVIVLERWGLNQSGPHKHRIVILRPGNSFEYTTNYEPTLSRRGSFDYYGHKYYVFQVS